MQLNRRKFLISSGSAAATAAALTVPSSLRRPASPLEARVVAALQTKFPGLDTRDPAVRQFVKALTTREPDARGASLTSLAEALDERHRIMPFERFVAQEFVASTNYLKAGQPDYPGLVFRDSAMA